MTRARWLRRWRALPVSARLLLLTMLVLLPLLSASLKILGYGRTKSLLDRITGLRAGHAAVPADFAAGEQWVRLAAIAGRRSLIRTTCLRQSLLVYTLLRARRLRPLLKIGVRRQGTLPDMHAWVELDGIALGQATLMHVAFEAPGTADHGSAHPQATKAMPDLVQTQDSPPLLRSLPAAPQSALGEAPFHVRTLPDGRLWCEVRRLGDAYHLRFPELADFSVRASGEVACTPTPGTDGNTVEHLFANQIIPAVLSLQHRPVFHASALSMAGDCIAFVGESGRGKSTLATFLARRGHPLLTDDGLELRDSEDGYLAIPNQHSVRLWEDSREALLPDDASALPPLRYTPKGRFRGEDLFPFCAQPAPLRRAYFLGDGTATQVSITPLEPQAAHLAWVKHSFILDVRNRQAMQIHFAQVSRLTQLGISYLLDYPREYDYLPRVEDALLDHHASCA